MSVTKVVLQNGLTVFLKEIHTAPLISHWVWYRVGSRNEVPGFTGISHWVEHMQFKGTPQFPAGVLDKAISRDGGVWNAFTYLDWTAYFETVPANKIELALRLEADRMVNSTYDPQETHAERTVILSEREGNENEPLFRLDEAIQKAAFQSHPYRYEVIGEAADLKRMQRDDLYQHYRKYYVPNNAVLALAGDFDAEEMLARVRQVYETIPAGTLPAVNIPLEPPLQAEQRLEISGPDDTTYLRVAYRAPAASAPDFFAFSVLDSLLSGPSSLNMFGGGGITNKTSRLYQALVERELAVSISGGMQATIQPFLYSFTCIVNPRHTPAEVLAALDDEIERLQQELVPPADIERAVKQARALFAYGSENITNQGFWLGYAEMFATYDWFLNYVQELEKITPADVQRIAQTYLRPAQRVVGVYRPDSIAEKKNETATA